MLLNIRKNTSLGGLFYVCPVFNGVISAGMEVTVENVENVVDIKP